MNQQWNHIIEENYNFRLQSFSFPPASVQNILLWHQWLGHGQKHNMSVYLESSIRAGLDSLSVLVCPLNSRDQLLTWIGSMKYYLSWVWYCAPTDLTWHIMTSWKSLLLNNTLTCASILIQAEWEKEDWFDCVEDCVKLMERSWHAMFGRLSPPKGTAWSGCRSLNSLNF